MEWDEGETGFLHTRGVKFLPSESEVLGSTFGRQVGDVTMIRRSSRPRGPASGDTSLVSG